uniref:Mos1 transposase HTH domain-containing protein n=1 Tax=Globodera rostochiensis TaxID=31243 RepID=A0A914HL00_GLORO
MEPQVDKNEHFRHLFLFEFNKGSKASEASQNICAVYGEGETNERTAQKWVLGWEVLPHPPCPDVAPSDYHLFKSLSNALSGVTLENAAVLQNWLTNSSRPNRPFFSKEGS